MNSQSVFFSSENPILIALIIFSVIIILVYIFARHFYFPLLGKFIENKKKHLKISNKLFETDPNPVIRITQEGLLIRKNKSADKLLSKHNLNLTDLIAEVKAGNRDEFSEGTFELFLNEQFYEVLIKKMPELDAVQLYLKDTTEVVIKERLINAYKKKVSELIMEQENKFLLQQNEIAKELHDSINHDLLLAIKRLENGDADFPETEELKKIYNNIRICSRNIKPVNFETDDFSVSLYNLTERTKRNTNLNIDLSVSDTVNQLKKEILFHIYRIIQELLSNTVKYADAENVEINLLQDENTYVLDFYDDGKGFDPQKIAENYYTSKGLGIINIQERINEIGAFWEIDSGEGKGTSVTITFAALYE